jgi:cell division protein ZapA
MKQIEVQIMGQGYVLGCPEGGEARLSEAVSRVDEAMCKIRDAGKIKARDRIAVLAALNLAFDLSDRSHSAHLSSTELAASMVPGSDKHAILQQLVQRLDSVLAGDNKLI